MCSADWLDFAIAKVLAAVRPKVLHHMLFHLLALVVNGRFEHSESILGGMVVISRFTLSEMQ